MDRDFSGGEGNSSFTIPNTTNLIRNREYFSSQYEVFFKQKSKFSSHFIDRLDLESVLKGHTGCVNCLEWSVDGKILISGSDDFQVILWDPFKGKRRDSIKTPHTGNIFSTKFLPNSNNTLIATAAADKYIYVTDVNKKSSIWNCSCHTERVKRLATAPDNPFIFWSAGEDGFVFQFDIRESHSSSHNKTTIVNLSDQCLPGGEAKCIAVNPRRSEFIAVGANDVYARLYDRRMIKPDSTDYVQYFCPGQFLDWKRMDFMNLSISYLTFNSQGTELLVNMGGDHVYLYDLYDSTNPKFLNLPEFPPENPTEINPSERKLPGIIESYKKMGNEFLENKKYLRAIDQYSEAISLAPECPVLYLNRATAFMQRLWFGDIYAALKDCHSALQLDPTYIKAHFRLAKALFKIDRVEDASACLEELLSRFPSCSKDHGVMMLKKDITKFKDGKPNGGTLDEVSQNEIFWRQNIKDYKERFVGHCNTTTDIKEANFIGEDGRFIVAGSDDGEYLRCSKENKTIFLFQETFLFGIENKEELYVLFIKVI
ncbi:WDTC1 family protein [Megaselia abdita]